MRLVATLLALVLSGRALARECPAECDCGVGVGEIEYICNQTGTVYQVNGLLNSFAKFYCESPQLDWTAIPHFPLSSNLSLQSFSLTNCELPTSFASALAGLGANDVRMLMLNGAPGELTAAHVEGLKSVDTILMIEAANQTRIPYDVLDALPQLADLRLRGGNFKLEENGGDDDPPQLAAPAHPALLALELGSPTITDIPPGAFVKFSNITKLFLTDNNIANFTSDSFRGLGNLQILDLSKNPLTSLPPRAFTAAPRLRILGLTSTLLGDVPSDAFEGLNELEEIQFKFGKAVVKFSPRALAGLPALKKLTLDLTPLDPLPGDLLDNSSAIEELTMKGTGIEALPEGLFRSQKMIKTLDLSGNKIKALDSTVFWPLKALQELNLDDNDIEELPPKLFFSITSLKSVSANNNGMKHIASDAFMGATFLEFLYLNDNFLTLEPKDEATFEEQNVDQQTPFRDLFELKELHLQGNNISTIFVDWRWLLVTNLRKLDLSRNNFTQLTMGDVQFLNYNLVVDLRHNHISTIDVLEGFPEALQDPDSQNADSKTSLLLDDNPFRCDCELYNLVRRLHGSKPIAAEAKLDIGNARCYSPPAFAGTLVQDVSPSTLTCSLRPQDCPANCTCDLRSATLTLELDCDAEPSEYPNPESFGLKATKLRLRSIQSLKLPHHIVSLNLTGVGLTEPPPLYLLQKIQELDLSENQLTVSPKKLLEANITLRLARNPFACDCSHTLDVFVLQQYKTRIYDADNVTCFGGESPWQKDAGRLCDVRRAAIIGGSLAALGILAAIMAALAYRYILEIKVFLFSRGWCQSLIQEDELDKNAQYDAFVSFSEKDARWVSEQLLPKLEAAPNNFKLCVHYRDWTLGDMIPAQIARSVEQSRRTIVVLSENFIKSTWAQLEFRAANVRAQRERRARVLVVVLGEVPDCKEMDAELRAYLSTNTYLKWGDPWFWEKLKFAMPHRRTGHLKEVIVSEKLKNCGIQARLNADGMIVNDATSQRF